QREPVQDAHLATDHAGPVHFDQRRSGGGSRRGGGGHARGGFLNSGGRSAALVRCVDEVCRRRPHHVRTGPLVRDRFRYREPTRQCPIPLSSSLLPASPASAGLACWPCCWSSPS